MKVPKTIKEFVNLKPWWKTPVDTRVVLSDNGAADILMMLEDEGRRPFFVADKALAGQREFARIFAEKNLFVFDATFSEPRTGDVDALRALIQALPEQPDTLVQRLNQDDDGGLLRLEIGVKTLIEESYLRPDEESAILQRALILLEYLQTHDNTFSLERVNMLNELKRRMQHL